MRTLALCALAVATLTPTLSGETDITFVGDSARVRHTLPIELKSGITEITHTGVAPQLVAATLILNDPSSTPSFEVLEQRIQRTTPTEDELLVFSQGKPLQFQTKDNQTIEGTLISARRGETGMQTVVESGGKYSTGLPGKPLFSELPPRYAPTTTLHWKIEAKKPGTYTGELLYETPNLYWRAHYTAFISSDLTSVNLIGALALYNLSGESFTDTQFRCTIPAPHIDTTPETIEIPRRINLANYEIKQVEYIKARGIKPSHQLIYDHPTAEIYSTNGRGARRKPSSELREIIEISNSPESHLGKLLPGGTLQTLLRAPDGSLTSIGSAELPLSSLGTPIRLIDRTAPSLSVETSIKPHGATTTIEKRIKNSRSQTVEVIVIDKLPAIQSIQAESTSHPYTTKEDNRTEWIVTVPPKGETLVSYTLSSPREILQEPTHSGH